MKYLYLQKLTCLYLDTRKSKTAELIVYNKHNNAFEYSNSKSVLKYYVNKYYMQKAPISYKTMSVHSENTFSI